MGEKSCTNTLDFILFYLIGVEPINGYDHQKINPKYPAI